MLTLTASDLRDIEEHLNYFNSELVDDNDCGIGVGDIEMTSIDGEVVGVLHAENGEPYRFRAYEVW